MKLVTIFISMIALSITVFAKDEAKRTPSSLPNGVVMGMPIMQPDMACRRAAMMGAVKEAMDDTNHAMDCNVESGVQMTSMNKGYTVKVKCTYTPAPGSHVAMNPEEFEYNVQVHRKPATKNRPEGCKVANVYPIETMTTTPTE